MLAAYRRRGVKSGICKMSRKVLGGERRTGDEQIDVYVRVYPAAKRRFARLRGLSRVCDSIRTHTHGFGKLL